MFAAYLYYIGRMMNKYRLFRKPQNKQVFAWAISTVITAGGCAVCVLIQKYEWAWKVFSYNQLFLTLASIDFVWIFLSMPERSGDKWQEIAKHTLVVYYIHTSTVFAYYRNLPLEWAAVNINPVLQVLILVVYAVLIYLVCALIDCVKYKAIGKAEETLIDKCIDMSNRWLS